MSKNGLEIYLVGINHKTSDVIDREKFQITRKELPEALDYFIAREEIEGVLILATCNRVEFYFAAKKGTKLFPAVTDYYNKFKDVHPEEYKDIFYKIENSHTTEHIFKVVSGLESLVLGEYQIQGQVKEAYSHACQHKTLEKLLHKLLHAAFRVGKKIRTNTSIGQGKQSVSGVAAGLLSEKLDPNDTITIIGVNENTKILTNSLVKQGFHNFIFANRTKYKAEMIADEFGGTATDLSQLEQNLFSSDAVFSSTGAKGFIVTSEILRRLENQERCPRLIVDMAIPRDIDTSELSANIEVYDLSKLKHYLKDQEEYNKMQDLPIAEKIIDDEVKLFQEWTESQSDEIMAEYAEKFETIRQQLVEEYRSQFSPQNADKIEKLTKSLMHRTKSTFVRILMKQQRN